MTLRRLAVPDSSASAAEAPLAERVDAALTSLARAGARLELVFADDSSAALGASPPRARVVLHDAALAKALQRGDHLTLAEAFLHGRIDIEGDPFEVAKLTDALEMQPSRLARLVWLLRLWLPGRIAYNAKAAQFHYDRPVEFFLPWFERWRSYSHGFYATPEDDPAAAQARKMQHAIDALGVKPGMRVFDMGGGWGCFVEYAGLQGIRVESITISHEQYRFVSDLIDRLRLPCTVQLVDFIQFRPTDLYDGAVFMGTLEHMPDYPRVARFLAQYLTASARVYADFCAQHRVFQVGAFLQKHLWPGPASYVDLAALVHALTRAGFNLHEVADDTLSYAWTVRDWARGLEAHRADLAARFGEVPVRAFLMFLWASYHFLTTNRSQAYHIVAGREPRAT